MPLTLCLTNDMHSRLDEAAALLDELAARRARGQLILDTGDMLEGAALFLILQGQAELGLLDALYDYACPGNHGFGAMRRHRFTSCRVLMLNLVEQDTGRPAFCPWAWLGDDPRSGVLFVGVMPPQVFELIPEHERAGLRCHEPRQALDDLLEHAAERCGAQPQTLIALSHGGLDDDLWRYQGVASLKLVLSSHCHSARDEADSGQGWRAVKAREHGQGFACLTLEDDSSWTVTHHAFEPRRAPFRDPSLVHLNPLIQSTWRQIDAVIGRYDGPPATRDELTVRFVAALQRELSAREDSSQDPGLVLINVTCLRRALEPGPVTYGMLLELFPFGNRLVQAQVDARVLARLIDDAPATTRDALRQGRPWPDEPPRQPGARLRLWTTSYLARNVFASAILEDAATTPLTQELGLLRDHFTRLCLSALEPACP